MPTQTMTTGDLSFMLDVCVPAIFFEKFQSSMKNEVRAREVF